MTRLLDAEDGPTMTARPTRLTALLCLGLVTVVLALPSAGGAASAAEAHSGRGGKPAVLVHNRLYRAKPLASAGCAAESTVPLDSVADLQVFYSSVLPCLNAAWKKSLKKTGIRFRPARVAVHSGERVGACHASLTYSYYCYRDRTIYMYAPEIISPWNQYPQDYSRGLTRLAAAHTIAHEFGHHLQYLSGILLANGGNIAGTQVERRQELQASCLGNAFLASQSDAYPISPTYLAVPEYWRYITLANHGSLASQELWTDRGYTKVKAGACDTFKVGGSKVS